MKQRVFSLCLIGFLMTFIVNGQEIDEVKYFLVDSLTEEPLPFATVVGLDPDFITTSDENGTILLDFSVADSYVVMISYVGYRSKQVTLTPDSDSVLLMSRSAQLLDSVMVSNSNSAKDSRFAKSIFKEAIKSLKKSSGAYIATGRYKHRIRENNSYVKIKDGYIDLVDEQGIGQICSKCNSPEERVFFSKSRESLDHSFQELVFFVTNYSFYLNEFDFLRHNRLRYEKEKFDNESVFRVEEISQEEQSVLYRVTVDAGFQKSNRVWGEFFNLAELVFDIRYEKGTDEYAIISFEKKNLSNRKKGSIEYSENSYFVVSLAYVDGIPVPEKVDHLLYQKIKKPSDTTIIEASHQLLLDEWEVDKKTVKNYQPPVNSAYDVGDWKDWPLTPDEIDGVSRYFELEKQFAWQDDADEVEKKQELLKYQLLKSHLKNGKNRKYLILWDNQEQVADYLFEGAYTMPTESMDPVFIYSSSLQDYRSWRKSVWTTDLMYFPGFYMPEEYINLGEKPLEIPAYLLFDTKGKLIKQDDQPLDLGN